MPRELDCIGMSISHPFSLNGANLPTPKKKNHP